MVKQFLKTGQILLVLSVIFAVGYGKDGSSYGNDTSDETIKVGQFYQGGVIAYIDATGQHGLIAAPGDLSRIQWEKDYLVRGATGTAIGTGRINTTRIVQAVGKGKYAAKLCDDLVLNGYSDWFLPSKDELNILYQNKDLIGGFSNAYYWSSSEFSSAYSSKSDNAIYAWCQDFGNGKQTSYYKKTAYHIRAVRAF